MKKFLFLIVMLIPFVLNAQKGIVKSLANDTLKGNNNNSIGFITATGSYNSLLIEVKNTKISSAAGGTLYLKGGLTTTTVQVLNASNSNVKFSTNDTLTVTDGSVWRVEIPFPADKYYEIWGDGDASDTVKVETKYIFK